MVAGINVVAYEPAFGIIGDPAKRDPNTRQSADHSMVFILSRKLRKAMQLGRAGLFEWVPFFPHSCLTCVWMYVHLSARTL